MPKGNTFFKGIGKIFIPLLPGFIVAGLCAGFASLLEQMMSQYQSSSFWSIVHTLLTIVNTSFTAYLSAWAGYSAAQKFGATPILGGMLGMITGLDGINVISQTLGLYNFSFPRQSILGAGSGGIMAILFGAWLLSVIEKFLHKRMPKNLDSVITPILAFLSTLIPYIFILMPVLGFISKYLCIGLGFICSNDNLVISLISGYVCAALFLPSSLFGLQFAFVALYALQLETENSIALLPVLAMAGASQVGAAISIFIKTKRTSNTELNRTVASGIVPGMLGVGQALLYGLSVPYPKAFVSTCLGAGFGGAYIVASKVSAAGWGPSGLLAIPLMTKGANSPLINMLNYTIGLGIACVCGFILTSLIVKTKDIEETIA